MGVAEERFRQVEEALKNIITRTGVARLVEGGAEPARASYPRVRIYARRGRSQRYLVGSSARMHIWDFEIVIETLSADYSESYEEALRIHWTIYEAILAEPNLGIESFFVDAEPAVEYELTQVGSDRGMYGHMLVQTISVRAEA